MKTNPLKDDGNSAKRSKKDAHDAALESAPESQRWDPLPGSPGHQVLPTPSEDEDDEGRSDNERLVEEGIAAAEDDQTRQADGDAKKRDERL